MNDDRLRLVVCGTLLYLHHHYLKMSSKSITASLHIQDQDCKRHYTYHLDGSMSSVVQSLKKLREDFSNDINKVIANQSTTVAHHQGINDK